MLLCYGTNYCSLEQPLKRQLVRALARLPQIQAREAVEGHGAPARRGARLPQSSGELRGESEACRASGLRMRGVRGGGLPRPVLPAR